MLPSSNTHELARRLPNSELVISHRLHAGVPAFFQFDQFGGSIY